MSRIFGLRFSNYNCPTTADQITTVHLQVYYNDPNTAKQLRLHYNYCLMTTVQIQLQLYNSTTTALQLQLRNYNCTLTIAQL